MLIGEHQLLTEFFIGQVNKYTNYKACNSGVVFCTCNITCVNTIVFEENKIYKTYFCFRFEEGRRSNGDLGISNALEWTQVPNLIFYRLQKCHHTSRIVEENC